MGKNGILAMYFILSHSGVTKGGTGGHRPPPHSGQVPPHMEIVILKKTYCELLPVPPQKIACPPGAPPISGCLVTPLLIGALQVNMWCFFIFVCNRNVWKIS